MIRQGDTASVVTIRDLRRDPSFTPGEAHFQNLVRRFLPLVHGSASSLLTEKPEAIENIVLAVFHSLAFRWRSLARRTVLATWLLRTTWVAAHRERRRLDLPAPDAQSPAGLYDLLSNRLFRLRPQFVDAIVLRWVFPERPDAAAKALHIKPARLERQAARGIERLAKSLRKKGVAAEPRALLQGIVSSPPLELESQVVDQLARWSPKEKRSDLVRATLRSWRWIVLKRRLRRLAVSVAAIVCLLVATAATFGWLMRQGYFIAWIIRHSQRQLAKEVPEITQPARPWPSSPADEPLASRNPPRSSAQLYGLTNIWLAKLSFTPEQWQKIEPSRVPPVPNMVQPNGRLTLRNPKATRSGLAGVLGWDFNWVESRLEFAGVTFSNVATRYRGNGTYLNSLFGPKQSFKVDLNKSNKKQNLAGLDELNFLNSIADNSYLRDALAEQLFRDLGVPAPRTTFAYLTIGVPRKFTNQPLGLYVLVENIDGDFASDRFGSKKTPLFKPVTYDLFRDLGNDWQAYAAIYDSKTEATSQEKERVLQFAHLVTHADDAEFARRLSEFLDIDEFAAFVAGHVLLASYDGFLTNGQNFYLYLDPRSNKFGFIPWDQDHAWGEFGYVGTAEKRERASIWQPSTYENRFLERVMRVPAFQEVYRRQLEEALAGPFSADRLYAQIDKLASLIRPAVAAESGFRLGRFDQSISTQWLSGPRDGAPEGPKAPVHQIKRFIANRTKSVREQLDGKSEGVVLMRHWEP